MLIRALMIILLLSGTGMVWLMVHRRQRVRRLSAMITLLAKDPAEKRLQQLKNNHEAELILEKKNRMLSYFRKLDASIIYKVGLMVLLFFSALAANYLFRLELSQNQQMMAGALTLVVAIILPGKLRSWMVNRRVKKMSSEIPWLVDLLAICVQCGMSLEAAFVFLSQKMVGINPDFAPFMERLVKRSEVSGLADGLRRFYQELPSMENRMLCATLAQSLQYGSSVYDQLITLARDIREVQLLTLEEKVGSLGAKMSVPLILFFMFPVVIVVAAPGVMRIF
ncbi:type II secretion system F family protein [Paramixta manurensis]|uniref:Type II secretion system F family protein n=1 Tax=Paramixta manurensis TaxID=2740817 RepID=A0A6M8UFQ9_9GAMM|nr:type II secretion system F family protein [Erwiniaceae bacterium PD-1]